MPAATTADLRRSFAKLATARNSNLWNGLSYGILAGVVTKTTCVEAVPQAAFDTCLWFPHGQLKVSPGGLWAISNRSSQPWDPGSNLEVQFAVIARFDAARVVTPSPLARLALHGPFAARAAARFTASATKRLSPFGTLPPSRTT